MPACTLPPRPFLPAYSGHFLAPPQPPAEPSLFSGPTLPVQTLVQYGIPHQTVTSSLNQKLHFPKLRVSHAPKRCTRYTRERYRRGLVNYLSGVSSPWPRKQLGSGQAGSVGLLPALPLLPPGSRAERNGTEQASAGQEQRKAEPHIALHTAQRKGLPVKQPLRLQKKIKGNTITRPVTEGVMGSAPEGQLSYRAPILLAGLGRAGRIWQWDCLKARQ